MLPSLRTLLVAGVLGGAVYAGLLGVLLSALARRPGVAPHLTRKMFHVGIYSGAAAIQLLEGLPGVLLYGGVVTSLVLTSLPWGGRWGLYRALARPGEGPRTREGVVAPLLATTLGGLVSNLLVGSFAVVGYLACGWGDGAGELVGRRWGRHPHRLSLPGKGRGRGRTLEGSAAVLVFGGMGAGVAILLLGAGGPRALLASALAGGAAALTEALSPGKLDDLTVQVVPALVVWWLLG